jgi:3-phosphoshikimate 1-carboxyvinyltransferase
MNNKQTSSELTRKIEPILHPLKATVRVPGSKSLTNRALLVAALAEGETVLENALFSDDTLFFASALKKLGFDIKLEKEQGKMSVFGLGGRIPARKADINIGNAGTAARFLTAMLTLGAGEYLLDGNTRMRERPIGDLIIALQQIGARIMPLNEHLHNDRKNNDRSAICPPIKIQASGLTGGVTKIAGNISSQFLSGILMVAPYASESVTLNVTTELISRPYIEMTIGVMADFGVEVEQNDPFYFLVHPSHYRPQSAYPIEPDASAASYFFAAPAILGGTVRLENVSRKSKQGDVAFLNILEQMGCAVAEGNDYIEVTGRNRLKGVDVDMRDISDTAQTLAAIAPFAASPTRIRGIGFINHKESERITDTSRELIRLGVEVQEYDDGLAIQPCKEIKSGVVHTYNDHRMAMAFSLIGLRCPGIQIENPKCVSKTFPEYFKVLESLR